MLVNKPEHDVPNADLVVRVDKYEGYFASVNRMARLVVADHGADVVVAGDQVGAEKPIGMGDGAAPAQVGQDLGLARDYLLANGVEGMRVGDKRKLTCPPQMAYGSSGVRGAIPPNATLVFDVELVDVR